MIVIQPDDPNIPLLREMKIEAGFQNGTMSLQTKKGLSGSKEQQSEEAEVSLILTSLRINPKTLNPAMGRDSLERAALMVGRTAESIKLKYTQELVISSCYKVAPTSSNPLGGYVFKFNGDKITLTSSIGMLITSYTRTDKVYIASNYLKLSKAQVIKLFYPGRMIPKGERGKQVSFPYQSDLCKGSGTLALRRNK